MLIMLVDNESYYSQFHPRKKCFLVTKVVFSVDRTGEECLNEGSQNCILKET